MKAGLFLMIAARGGILAAIARSSVRTPLAWLLMVALMALGVTAYAEPAASALRRHTHYKEGIHETFDDTISATHRAMA